MSKIQHKSYEHDSAIDSICPEGQPTPVESNWWLQVTKENLEYSQHRQSYFRGWATRILLSDIWYLKANTHDVRNLLMHER